MTRISTAISFTYVRRDNAVFGVKHHWTNAGHRKKDSSVKIEKNFSTLALKDARKVL